MVHWGLVAEAVLLHWVGTAGQEKPMNSPSVQTLPETFEGKKAFTLVEVLVVTGIIAVLAGLLLPVLTAARHRAKGTACVSNLRQLHAALSMYAADFSGLLPPYQNQIGVTHGGDGLPERPIPELGDL